MSRLYGVIETPRGRSTRCGVDSLRVQAAGWQGAIEVTVEPDRTDAERDRFTVHLIPWKASGGSPQLIASGVLDATVTHE
jgi:hypothetical protein